VQSFTDELTAFRTFAESYPENCILLVDTYNTLISGVPNAIRVGREMESRGKKLKGVRLDSGDLAYLSKKVRGMLDDAGLGYIRIVASNQLDEYVIKSLLDQQAPIDIFGVGTALVTGQGAGALDGVYKLSSINGQPCLKVSDNIRKTTLPGKKNVYRFFDDRGRFVADGISLEREKELVTIHHPFEPGKSTRVAGFRQESIMKKMMAKGRILNGIKFPGDNYNYLRSRLACLPEEHLRFMNPHEYKVGISSDLLQLKNELTAREPTEKINTR
jgi:nicotinate phosphoribosyltransferase